MPQDTHIDKFDRFQLLHRHFLSHRRPIPVSRLAELLECTEKTVKRCIDQMRNYLDAPIEYFPEARGWHYADKDRDLYQLPGLWLTASELQSLALLLQLLDTFGNGLLNRELAVIDSNIGKLLAARGIERSAFEQHIRVLPLNNRYIANQLFAQVCEAILGMRQMRINYSSFNQEQSTRTISPQTLVYYRENWYLDAWCHLRQDLRTFSLARIEKLQLLNKPARKVPPEQLKAHFTQGYGIFAGAENREATLRFLPGIAREIAMQRWHPGQSSEWDGDDYLLTIPYADDRELIQDVLRHVPNVYVESPVELRKAVQDRLHRGLEVLSGKRIRRP